jgi:hypothetical protein
MRLERIQLPATALGKRVGYTKDATEEERKKELLNRERKASDEEVRADVPKDEKPTEPLVTSEPHALDIRA